MDSIKSKTITGFIWRFCQNISAQFVSFVVSIVLARLLTPEDYGLIAMITVFTSIALVFINIGFTSSVIQKKDLSETDINTAFYSGILMAFLLYGLLFSCAPAISGFYNEPKLVPLFRAESLIVIIGALYAIPQAMITRTMEFRKSFVISIVGVTAQGIAGISMALAGAGAWALVASTLVNYITNAIVTWHMIQWKPSLRFSFASLKKMYAFSIQMLLGALMDSFFNNIRAIIIGKQYSTQDLAYYNRGYQFPSLFMMQVDGSITTVLFSSLSKYQDSWEDGLRTLRRSLKTSMFICMPLMFGLMAIAEPMILVLLTDKWAGSIEYVRLTAMVCLFWPLSAERHALNARGFSHISLRLNIVGKTITLASILLTYRYSIRLMIVATIIAAVLNHLISMAVYTKYLEYRMLDQIADLFPSLLLSIAMGLITYCVSFLSLGYWQMLVLQIAIGIAAYVILSAISHNETFFYLIRLIQSFLKKSV